jgi:hypothetical protein
MINSLLVRRSDCVSITDATIADGSTVISFPRTLAPGDDLLLRRSEVAALLRVSHGYLRHMGARLLPVVRIGGAVRYKLSDVLTLIEQSTVTAEDVTRQSS